MTDQEINAAALKIYVDWTAATHKNMYADGNFLLDSPEKIAAWIKNHAIGDK